MDEKKRSILKLLEREREMFTLEIARSLSLSPPTTSKYLEILKAEGKVTSYKRLPYIYWRRAALND
jgi:DNA-binding Lrp family transcriptional regulator